MIAILIKVELVYSVPQTYLTIELFILEITPQ